MQPYLLKSGEEKEESNIEPFETYPTNDLDDRENNFKSENNESGYLGKSLQAEILDYFLNLADEHGKEDGLDDKDFCYLKSNIDGEILPTDETEDIVETSSGTPIAQVAQFCGKRTDEADNDTLKKAGKVFLDNEYSEKQDNRIKPNKVVENLKSPVENNYREENTNKQVEICDGKGTFKRGFIRKFRYRKFRKYI